MPTLQVALTSDIEPGEMITVRAAEREVLLCNVEGTISAFHPKCTHYGAPLVDGVLNGFRLRCPWHHACFDARTGRHLEAPGCDALQAYPVEVREGGQVWITVPAGKVGSGQHPNPMVAGGRAAAKPYVIVGGGPAGQHAAEGLRQGGYRGPITLISAEDRPPYDRTQVSKGFLTGDRPADKMPLRPRSFYEAHDVKLMLGRKVTKVRAGAHQLELEDGSTLDYEKVCVATGSTVRRLNVKGADLPAVYTLRTYADAEALREAASAVRKAVVVGSSFIGMEGAAALAKLGAEVTVVAPEEHPFQSIFGQRVGSLIQSWHEENGINFRLGEEVARIKGKRKATGVVLEGGDVISANIVLVGIGVTPNSNLIEGIEPGEDGGIAVDEHCYADQDVWVAGDIASAFQGGSRARIEHWKVAEQQGRVAGVNMAGAKLSYLSVPYFWTQQAGKNLRYSGHHTDFDSIVFDGEPERGGAWLAYYIEGERVSAVLGYKRDTDMAAIAELMWLDAMPSASTLDPSAKWQDLL